MTQAPSCNKYSYMKRNSQLSVTLHVLLHLADKEAPVTSELLADALSTNPVVIRRMIGRLREFGLVESRKGHNGGWVLMRNPSKVSLKDVYEALGSPGLLALSHRTESPDCLVEQAVNASLGEAFQEAEAKLLDQFSKVTLSALLQDVHKAAGRVPHLCAKGKAA